MFTQKLHLNETAVYIILSSKLQSKQLECVGAYLVLLEVSSGRTWKLAEAGIRVVLGFAGGGWVRWEKEFFPVSMQNLKKICTIPRTGYKEP